MTSIMDYNNFAMKENDPGIIRSVRGSVVDVFFPKRLPDIYSRLVTGKDSTTEIEVISHLSANLVRCVALTQTSGWCAA
jgi:F-type H+/Na+-transporting ATPase subunit beta